MTVDELTTVGLTDGAHRKLKWLKEEQYFRELLDGYRFAIGLALAQGIDPPEIQNRRVIFNVGTFDPDQSIKQSIEVILGERTQGKSIYKIAERLAEWGVHELESQAQSGKLDLVEILDQVSQKTIDRQ